MEPYHQRAKRKLLPSPTVAPWLVFPHGKDSKFQTFCNIFDPMNKSYKKIIPELSKRRFWQKNSHQGWLIVVCDDDVETKFNFGNCFLWNPKSLETIMLPNLLHGLNSINFDEYYVKEAILSSPPQSISSNGGGGSTYDDSMVYMLLNGAEKPDFLFYCHPGEKKWRKHEFVNITESLRTMLINNGKLFIMCVSGFYLEIEIQRGSDVDEDETLNISEFIWIDNNVEHGSVAGGLDCRVQQYWMESFGDVYKIERFYIPRVAYQNCVTQVIISKLNFSTMAWEDVKSLDDYVFFLSNRTQLSCLASELGLSKGCVYYTQNWEMSLYRYDLRADSILLSVPCPELPTPWFTPEWLMITTTPRFDDKSTADRVLGKEEHMDKVVKAVENIAVVSKDGQKEDVEEATPWTMLQDDMVRSISKYLHTVDYIQLRAVSKKHRSILSLRRSSSTWTTPDLSPWMVFSKYNRSVYSFVNSIRNNDNYLMNIPELLKGSRIRFSKGGWLLISKGNTLCFYNPFTRSSIELPELPDQHCYDFSGISFSSLPTSSDCVVFGVSKQLGDNVFTFFIKRGDEHWTIDFFDSVYLLPDKKPMEFEADFNSPVFHCGAFYCLDINGTLGVSKLEHGISWEILATATRPNCEFIYKSFLVECEGKLLSVFLGHFGRWVRIFRLDDTGMVWVEVKHLGRYMLFISNTSCISAVARTSQMENKVYFPRLHNNYGILYYSLDTGMYHCFGSTHCAKDFRDSDENLNCSWIEPDWSETSDEYLHWLSVPR